MKYVLPVALLLISTLSITANNTNKNSRKLTLDEPKAASKLNPNSPVESIYKDLTHEQVVDYYGGVNSPLNGKNGKELIVELEKIISKNHKKITYSSGIGGSSTSWLGYALVERDYDLSPLTSADTNSSWQTTGIWTNPMYIETPIYHVGKINDTKNKELQYKNEKGELVSTTYKGYPFDREHVWPKSIGFNISGSDAYQDLTAGCDLHNLHLAEHKNNICHSNYMYGNVTGNYESEKNDVTGTYTGKIQRNADEKLTVYEPLDKDKGDIARSVFYMATRYHTFKLNDGKDIFPALGLGESLSRNLEPLETENEVATYGKLSDLLAWNEEDTVNKFEHHRNNLVFNAIQFNRNPYIDFPKWAELAFGKTNKVVDLSQPDGVKAETKIQITPPSKTRYYIGESFDKTGFKAILIDSDGNEKDITNEVKIEGFDSSTKGTKKITVKYLDEGKEIVTEFEVTIIEKGIGATLGDDLINVDCNKTYTKEDILNNISIFNTENDEKVSEISLDDPKLQISLVVSESEIIDLKTVESFKFEKDRTYTIKVAYEKFNFELLIDTYEIKIDFELNITTDEKLNELFTNDKISGKELLTYIQVSKNKEGNISSFDETEKSRLKYYLTYPSGKEVEILNTDTKIDLNEEGKYIVRVDYVRISSTIEFELRLPTFIEKYGTIIFIVSAVVLLIIVIIILISIRKKKKAKKAKKASKKKKSNKKN